MITSLKKARTGIYGLTGPHGRILAERVPEFAMYDVTHLLAALSYHRLLEHIYGDCLARLPGRLPGPLAGSLAGRLPVWPAGQRRFVSARSHF